MSVLAMLHAGGGFACTISLLPLLLQQGCQRAYRQHTSFLHPGMQSISLWMAHCWAAPFSAITCILLLLLPAHSGCPVLEDCKRELICCSLLVALAHSSPLRVEATMSDPP